MVQLDQLDLEDHEEKLALEVHLVKEDSLDNLDPVDLLVNVERVSLEDLVLLGNVVLRVLLDLLDLEDLLDQLDQLGKLVHRVKLGKEDLLVQQGRKEREAVEDL